MSAPHSTRPLTNYEVFLLLSSQPPRLPNPVKRLHSQVLQYLSPHHLRQNESTVRAFLSACSQYNLTPKETLLLLNLLPTTLVEIFLIVDNCEERLGMTRAEDLLLLSQSAFS